MKSKHSNSVFNLLLIPVLGLAVLLMGGCPDSNATDDATEEVDLGSMEEQYQKEADKEITSANVEQMAADLLKEIQEDEAAGR